MRILFLLLFSLPAYATTIITDDGRTIEVDEDFEVRIVPKGAPDVCIGVEGITLERVERFAPDCVNREDGPFFSPHPPFCDEID